MRYVIFGRVHPERAGAWFSPLVFRPGEGHSYTLVAESAQVTVIADVPDGTGFRDVFVMAELMAEAAISALAFAHGTGWYIELTQIVGETIETFGVKPQDLDFENPHELFARAIELGRYDVFFRLALRDYARAMSETIDCAYYCYRAIEAIKSSFEAAHAGQGWPQMHRSLGTNREEVDTTVKGFADPVRHGAWAAFPPTSAAQRHDMLKLTRKILTLYLERGGPA